MSLNLNMDLRVHDAYAHGSLSSMLGFGESFHALASPVSAAASTSVAAAAPRGLSLPTALLPSSFLATSHAA